MTTNQIPRGAPAIPKRSAAPILIPSIVCLLTLALLAWSAWPVLRSSRSIEITQAVLVQSSAPDTSESQSDNEVSQASNARTIQAAGWLEAEPFYTAATALADGIIEELLVLEGDRVEVGQVLARMVDDDAKLALALAEADHHRARAAASQARAELTAAESNWESPYELERGVRSAKAALAERQGELVQLPALIRTESSLLIQAQEELASIERAYRSNAAAEIEFITAREQANAQQARLEAIQAREPVLRATIDRIASDLLAAQRALELRIDDRARLESARASFELANAQVAQSQAKRDIAVLELERMTITAPISGYVQRRLKVPGDKVIRMMDSPHSAHIVHLYDPSKLQVRVDVPLADASQVSVGQECQVVVEVLADRTFRGEVLRITHEADLQKNTLQVKVRVIDPDPVLRPEMLTRVKFLGGQGTQRSSTDETNQSDGVVWVPERSIDRSSESAQVWQITDRANGRGVLQPITVTPIARQSDWVTIRSSLQPGAMIAADPSGCVPGERVKIALQKDGAS